MAVNAQDTALQMLATGTRYIRRSLKSFRLQSPVLELGAGDGNITRELCRMGHTVFATELDPARVAALKQLPVQARVCDLNTVRADELRAWAQPQSAIAINVIEHLAADGLACEMVRDVLPPGGTFGVLVPAHEALYSRFDRSIGHYRRYTVAQVRRLLEFSGFEVEHARYFNMVGALGWLVNCTLLGRPELPPAQFRAFDRLTPLLELEDKLPAPFGLSVVALGRRP